MHYDFNRIEEKWQDKWRTQRSFQVENNSSKPKYYILDMFPYPSGSGLHVGHPLGYIASDIIARYKRMLGFNVLHPMGWDAFGLPAEQYAIQTGQHPAETTRRNIERFREQLNKMGLSFDWNREVSTASPSYYKWTQWTVIQLFNSYYDEKLNKAQPIGKLVEHFASRGSEGMTASGHLAASFTAKEWQAKNDKAQEDILQEFRLLYISEGVVNWCPALGTVLANDEVAGGYSVRGNHPVEQKAMKQWALRITAYADRLLANLDKIDWPEAVVETQRNWIGKSKGAQLFFGVEDSDLKIEVFTTRPETIFGSTFLVLAPEHPLVASIATAAAKDKVQAYQDQVKLLSERERIADVNKVTGEFTGRYAIHPFTQQRLPIWIGDYVIASYGTGAIMAVPAHDGRDHSFAKAFGLPIVEVIKSGADVQESAHEAKEGVLVNSSFLNGLAVVPAVQKVTEEIETAKIGKPVIRFRLRDAIFSRQRYWGEPLPFYYKDGVPKPLAENSLPLTLPEIDKYLPTETGEPPLGRAAHWETVDGYKFDLNTMPGFAGSSAYFLRYMDPHNDQALVSREAASYWQAVDLYVGGREHATGHLIYSRFWNMFLYDLGVAVAEEPFKKLLNQGMITGRSNFVYRVKGENRFVSLGLKDQYDTVPVHVDIKLAQNDQLDLAAFRSWRPEFADASFVLEDGKYHCGWAIEKMSKSYYNVTNPDDIIQRYGADTLRLYEMFLGPIDQSKPWKNDGIEGVHRFLKRFWSLVFKENGELNVTDQAPSDDELRIIHPLIKKIREDMTSLSFNTAVSAFMIAQNALLKLEGQISRKTVEMFLQCLSPFAPHIAEEVWEKLGHKDLLLDATIPEFDEQYVVSSKMVLPISLNGKKRVVLELPLGLDEATIKDTVLKDAQVTKALEGKTIKKIIYVEGRMFNIVV